MIESRCVIVSPADFYVLDGSHLQIAIGPGGRAASSSLVGTTQCPTGSPARDDDALGFNKLTTALYFVARMFLEFFIRVITRACPFLSMLFLSGSLLSFLDRID